MLEMTWNRWVIATIVALAIVALLARPATTPASTTGSPIPRTLSPSSPSTAVNDPRSRGSERAP